jgi:hypothetical protein
LSFVAIRTLLPAPVYGVVVTSCVWTFSVCCCDVLSDVLFSALLIDYVISSLSETYKSPIISLLHGSNLYTNIG